jgi:uncharacterized membrane protein YccC
MAIAITVVLSQLYQELYEFSYSLLLFRLAETALGAAIAILVVAFVFPLRTRRVLRVAFRNHVRAIATLVDHASEVLTTAGPTRGGERLRGDTRAVDACYQTLLATAEPISRGVFGNVDQEMRRAVRLATVSRNYSRDLVADLATSEPIDSEFRSEFSRASATLQDSMGKVAEAITGLRDGAYVRSASLYDRTERSLENSAPRLDQRWLAIRDLQLIDGSMATFAESIGLKVTDFDTSLSSPVV